MNNTIYNTINETRLSKVIQSEREIVTKDLSRQTDLVKLHQINQHAWKVFVKIWQPTSNNTSYEDVSDAYISQVEFRLHPTFYPSEIVITEPPYELCKAGWGAFVIDINVTMRYPPIKTQQQDQQQDHNPNDERILEFQHPLSFDSPKVSTKYKNLKRHNLEIEVGNLYFNLLDEKYYDPLMKQSLSSSTTLSSFQKQVTTNYPFPLTDEVSTHLYGYELQRRQLVQTKQELDQVHMASTKLLQLVQQIPKERHNMALGAYLAGVYQGNIHTKYLMELYNFAITNLRYIILDETTLSNGQFQDLIINWKVHLKDKTTLQRAYNLSKPLRDTDHIDYFISHCWNEPLTTRQEKVNRLLQLSHDFQTKHNGRLPKIWLDMFCMDQTCLDSVEKNITCLPLFLKAATTVIVLLSPTLMTRLWCLVEIYTAYILSPKSDEINLGFELHPLAVLEEQQHQQPYGNMTKQQQRNTLQNIRVDNHDENNDWMKQTIQLKLARCGSQRDQDLLFKNLDDAPGGVLGVEKALNEAFDKAYAAWNKSSGRA